MGVFTGLTIIHATQNTFCQYSDRINSESEQLVLAQTKSAVSKNCRKLTLFPLLERVVKASMNDNSLSVNCHSAFSVSTNSWAPFSCRGNLRLHVRPLFHYIIIWYTFGLKYDAVQNKFHKLYFVLCETARFLLNIKLNYHLTVYMIYFPTFNNLSMPDREEGCTYQKKTI